MSSIPAGRRAGLYEQVAVALAGLGIAAALLVAWYAGTVLSLAAASALAGPIWLGHRPMSRWTRIAVLLVIVGLIIQLAIALVSGLVLTPITPVRAG